MDGKSGNIVQSLPDTLSSLMGLNKYLAPSYIESVSHIIEELSPTKPKMKVMVHTAQNICSDDTDSDAEAAKVQGMQF
jgi:kinesin family member C1